MTFPAQAQWRAPVRGTSAPGRRRPTLGTTLLVLGSLTVPPFGRPIIDADLYVDTSLLTLPAIAFGLGDKTHLICMSPRDWVRATGAEAFGFAA